MRRMPRFSPDIPVTSPAAAAAALVAVALVLGARPAAGQDASHAVAGGGITVPGWTGRVDPGEARSGQVIANAKFAPDAGGFRVTTGPASAFWNPANHTTGDYTVRATFTEPAYMNLNPSHPHPYGLFVAGHDMGTDQQSYLYCAAYGNGSFIVRGFGPAPFRVNGQGPQHDAAVHQAVGPGQPVTQDIAITVRGDSLSCAINGTVVGRYAKADLVGPGKLQSLDGVYGIRAAHNTAVIVTKLTATSTVTR